MFSISTFLNSFEPLFWAARYTLLISGLGIALGLVVGALICAAALSRVAWLRWFAALWVSFLRGVPLLVQLLLCYYLLPVVGINVPAMVAAVVTVGICSSAYVSEIWRGAIIALPNGQARKGQRPFTTKGWKCWPSLRLRQLGQGNFWVSMVCSVGYFAASQRRNGPDNFPPQCGGYQSHFDRQR